MSRAWLLSRTSTVSLFSYSELFSSWICWEEETNCELLEFVTCLFHFSPKKTEMFCGDRVYFVLLQAFTGLSNNSNTLNPSMGSKIPLKKHIIQNVMQYYLDLKVEKFASEAKHFWKINKAKQASLKCFCVSFCWLFEEDETAWSLETIWLCSLTFQTDRLLAEGLSKDYELM